MPDVKYCYPDSNVLKNKLNIHDAKELFNAEKELTTIRLRELQENPLKGDFRKPLEPVHIHLCKGKPSQNATKYWILGDGVTQDIDNWDLHL